MRLWQPVDIRRATENPVVQLSPAPCARLQRQRHGGALLRHPKRKYCKRQHSRVYLNRWGTCRLCVRERIASGEAHENHGRRGHYKATCVNGHPKNSETVNKHSKCRVCDKQRQQARRDRCRAQRESA